MQQQRDMPGGEADGATQVMTGLAIEVATRQTVAAGHHPGQRTDQRPDGESARHHRQRQPQRQDRRAEHQQHQAQRHRRDQRAPQVVDQLPAVDRRDAVAPRPRDEGQQLPIATRPAVQPGMGDIGMHRRVLDQRDVGHARTARDAAFQQVVAQHLALGQAGVEHRVAGTHVQQALAGEAALAEQVLEDLRADGAVGIDAELADEEPVVGRAGSVVGHRREHPRLQDRVALDDTTAGGVHPRPVHRMRGRADERAQPARRHVGVGIQRDQVAHARRRPGQRAEVGERRRAGGRGQQPQQPLELAALALPADPATLGGGPFACPMQQQEARTAIGQRAVALVERGDRIRRGDHDHRVAGVMFLIGIGQVAEQRELHQPLGIGQVMLFQLGGQGGDGLLARQQHRHDDQGAFGVRKALGKVQAGQPRRPGELADPAVGQRDHRLADRPRGQQRGEGEQPGRRIRPGLVHQPGETEQAQQRQASQVGHRRPALPGGGVVWRPGMLVQAERREQRRPARAAPPVDRRAAPVRFAIHRRTGALRQRQQLARDLQFRAPGLAGQALDLMQGQVLGVRRLGREDR